MNAVCANLTTSCHGPCSKEMGHKPTAYMTHRSSTMMRAEASDFISSPTGPAAPASPEEGSVRFIRTHGPQSKH
eukprot:10627622-Alexandrium_andersonii.AAC.1